jgi:hypothetical protein
MVLRRTRPDWDGLASNRPVVSVAVLLGPSHRPKHETSEEVLLVSGAFSQGFELAEVFATSRQCSVSSPAAPAGHVSCNGEGGRGLWTLLPTNVGLQGTLVAC